jgi:6-phosphogluconolactonase
MKLRKSGEILLAIAASLSSALLITACGNDHTIDFVYATSSKNNPGQVAVFKLDSGSGLLRVLATSPYPTGSRNPIAEVGSPDSKNLYVVNRDDNTVLQFAVGTDGKLYPQNTYNTPGGFPVGVAISHDGAYLYVVDTYQPGYTDPIPGPGAVVVYPITSSGALGTPVPNGNLEYFPVGFFPVGIVALGNGNSVYVASKGGGPNNEPGRIYEFSVAGASASVPGALIPIGTGSVPAGISPTGLASTGNSNFVYATDSTANLVYGFAVDSTGNLTGVPNSPFKTTGQFPVAATVDSTSTFLYVVNYDSGNINSFLIDGKGSLAPGKTTATGAGPTCLSIEPAQGKYLYVSNFLDGTVSGFQLDTTSGSLVGIQNSPYATPGQTTCVTALLNVSAN